MNTDEINTRMSLQNVFQHDTNTIEELYKKKMYYDRFFNHRIPRYAVNIGRLDPELILLLNHIYQGEIPEQHVFNKVLLKPNIYNRVIINNI